MGIVIVPLRKERLISLTMALGIDDLYHFPQISVTSFVIVENEYLMSSRVSQYYVDANE